MRSAADVLALIMAEFVAGLESARDSNGQNSDHFEATIKELELELQNLVNAIAKGKSSTSVLDCIHQRESELDRLKALVKRQQTVPPQISPETLATLHAGLLDICDLIKIDVTKAKVELGKHLSEIVMRPRLGKQHLMLMDNGIC